MTAGVTFNGSVRLDRPFEPTHIVNYSMAGTRGNLNDITIDGAPSTATANANEVTASYVPPTDIVQEFKVQTATFDAQFGQTQGGVTNFIIKSGTNELHGSAGYSFYRPLCWPTTSSTIRPGCRPRASNSTAGADRSAVRCVLPKIYNGTNKTFFLWGYEGIQDSRPRHDDATNTVPTAAMHNGDFSALLAGGGAAYTIYDPFTRAGSRTVAISRLRFRATSFRQCRFDPVGAAILSYFPTTPKSPGDALGLNNYRGCQHGRSSRSIRTTPAAWTRTSATGSAFSFAHSSYRRDSTYNDYFNNPATGIQFLVRLQGRRS